MCPSGRPHADGDHPEGRDGPHGQQAHASARRQEPIPREQGRERGRHGEPGEHQAVTTEVEPSPGGEDEHRGSRERGEEGDPHPDPERPELDREGASW